MSSALQGVGVVCSGRRAWRGWRGGHRVLEEPEAEEVTRRSPRSPAPLRTPLRPVQSAAAEPRRGRGGGLAGLAQTLHKAYQGRKNFHALEPDSPCPPTACNPGGLHAGPCKTSTGRSSPAARGPRKGTGRATRSPRQGRLSSRKTDQGLGVSQRPIRAAALRSPYCSPVGSSVKRSILARRGNFMTPRRFQQELDHVASGIRNLKNVSKSFDDCIEEDERRAAREQCWQLMVSNLCATTGRHSCGFKRTSLHRFSARLHSLGSLANNVITQRGKKT
ncbi:uncharacterized protein LOC144730891 isoform X1 [Lampetra planeri]